VKFYPFPPWVSRGKQIEIAIFSELSIGWNLACVVKSLLFLAAIG
jgi:hypothetical protein